jgi:Protein of unknown function (DUF4011)
MTTLDPRSANRSRLKEDASVGVADPSIQAMVKRGILKAREKLIDLTLRNGMLSFRHTEASGRHVRIVNATLEFLVASLTSGQSLDIVPLPPVEQIPRDEDTDEFRAALKAAKEINPEWLAAEDARRAAGNRRRSRDKAAERALRDRVRAQLGMPEWRSATDPKVRAQELGIDPSYELPDFVNTKNQSRQTLQTLFFPDRLEPKLSTLYSAARALQEDAGLSALHCAAGFLEWYEAEDSPDPAFAPLLLLPINMEKRIANGEYIFSITGRDDDETVNVALHEKLRRLDLVLPDYNGEALPVLRMRSKSAHDGEFAASQPSACSPSPGRPCGATSILRVGQRHCAPRPIRFSGKFTVTSSLSTRV